MLVNNNMDFSRISCLATRDMCVAVRQLELWDFVRQFEDDQHGFMFSSDHRVDQIRYHPLVTNHGHSGGSFGFCCRNVQFIAINGLDAYCAKQKSFKNN